MKTFVKRNFVLFLSVLFLFQQTVVSPLAFHISKSPKSGTGREYVSPNPGVYPGFYQKTGQNGGGIKDGSQKDSSLAAPAKSSVSQKRLSGSQSSHFNSGTAEKVLIIPIQFTDKKFDSAHGQAYFQGIMTQFKDYYEKNSNYIAGTSGITVSCDIAPVVTSTHAMAYYGADVTDIDESSDHSIYELAREAVLLSDNNVNFDNFDSNSDNKVDHIFIVHAGEGQEDSASANDIWSHQWSIGQTGQPIDHVTVYNYICVPETGTLGVFAHEFGHDLGLPDLYDTDDFTNGISFGAGAWDIMGSGSWNRLPGEAPGTCPANLSAWSKAYLGWITPQNVTTGGRYTLINTIGNNSALTFWTNGNVSGGEYFIAEYRRKNGYDAGLPGEGLLVWHVDDAWMNTPLKNIGNAYADSTNTVLTGNHVNAFAGRLGLELEQADGQWDMWTSMQNPGDSGDPFPGSTGNQSFSTSPFHLNYSNINSETSSCIELLHIKAEGSVLTMDSFISPSIPGGEPKPKAPADGVLYSSAVTFIWEGVPLAKYYKLQISSSKQFNTYTEYSISAPVVYDISKNTYAYTVDNLTDITSYWRIAAVNDTGTGPWSTPRSIRKESIGPWISLSDIPTPRNDASAALLDGKIYVIGGEDPATHTALNTNEMYDPLTNSWTSLPPMPTSRYLLGVAEANGHIYAMGGYNPRVQHYDTIEMYDPKSNSWTNAGKMSSTRCGFGIISMNNKIYVLGGLQDGSYVSTFEEYDPAAGTWKTLASLPAIRENFGITQWNGKIYVAGGIAGNVAMAKDDLWEYDPVTDSWTAKADMPTAKDTLSLSVINGKLYTIGGLSTDPSYIYNIADNTWSTDSTTPAKERLYFSIVTQANTAYIFGGYNGGLFTTSEAYSPGTSAPEVPANLHVAASSQDSITVAWDTVDNATGYLLRVDGEEIYCNSNTYSHNSLDPNSIHQYSVRAYNTHRTSGWSSELAAATADTYTIAAQSSILEGSEDSGIITLTLAGAAFRPDGIYNKSTFTITPGDLPAGVTEGNVSYIDSNHVQIALSGNSTVDYDTNMPLHITISENEISIDRYIDPAVNTVMTATLEPQPSAPDPAVSFNFDNLKLADSATNMEYSLDGGTAYHNIITANQTLSGSEADTITSANDILIRIKATLRTPAGVVQTINILQGPAAPAVTADDTANTVSGMLTGMEYSKNNTTWTSYTGSLPDLSGNCTLCVRVKAAGLTAAGTITTMTFTTNPSSGNESGGGGGNGDGGGGGGFTGGGGGGFFLTVIPEENTPAGPVLSDSVGIVIDPDKLGAKIKDTGTKEVVIEIPGSAKSQSLAIDISTYSSLQESGKGLEIKGQDVSLALDPGAIEPSLLKNAGAGAYIKIGMDEVPESDADKLLADAAKDDGDVLFSIGGRVFEFSAQIVSEKSTQAITSFKSDVTVTISLQNLSLKGIDIEKLGVYWYNETTKAWEYAGGTYNPATNSITFITSHFSKYTVMKYDKTFSDISKHWAKKDIEIMASKYIAKGSGDKFNPDGTITRAEFISLLVRALGLKDPGNSKTNFSDVKNSAWYYSEIGTALSFGITSKTNGAMFRPDVNITREEMAVMIINALKVKGKISSLTKDQVAQKLKVFKDAAAISEASKEAVAIAVNLKIIAGRSGGLFAPSFTATRAEAIVMIRRLLAAIS